MDALTNRIRRWGHWMVFLLLEVTSLVLLFRFNTYQGSVWWTQANAVAGRVLEWESQLVAYAQQGEVNRKLTDTNIQLQQENEALRQQLKRLRHVPTYTERVVEEQLWGTQRIAAQVISNSIRDKDNLITINRGRRDGVRNEMGVVCGTGIVGIVCQTGEHYALVLSVLNSHSSISCRLKDTEYFGYLKWNGGSPLRAYIDDIPRHARIREGEMVETSGFSSVFPPGIFVGRVRHVQNSDDGLSYKLEIGLSTDFSRLRDVMVITDTQETETEDDTDIH